MCVSVLTGARERVSCPGAVIADCHGPPDVGAVNYL